MVGVQPTAWRAYIPPPTRGQRYMCLSKASSWSECSPQPGGHTSTNSSKEARALEPEILLSDVTLTDSADDAFTRYGHKICLM